MPKHGGVPGERRYVFVNMHCGKGGGCYVVGRLGNGLQIKENGRCVNTTLNQLNTLSSGLHSLSAVNTSCKTNKILSQWLGCV